MALVWVRREALSSRARLVAVVVALVGATVLRGALPAVPGDGPSAGESAPLIASIEALDADLVAAPGVAAPGAQQATAALGFSSGREGPNARGCPSSTRGVTASDPVGLLVRGCFLAVAGRSRPYVDATLQFPSIGKQLDVRLLVDTGADRTVLGPQDAARLGIDYAALARGQEVGGLGGRVDTRVTDATLAFESLAIPISLTVLDPGATRQLAVPSLLGRDVLAQFALFMDESRGRVLLFERRAADALVP